MKELPPHVMLAQTWSLQDKAYWVARTCMLAAESKLCTNCVCEATLTRVAPMSSAAV